MEFEDEIGEKYFEIKEVYYNRDGTLMGYCDASVSGESFGDVISTLDIMKEDAHKSVLKPSDFEGESDEVTSAKMDETKVTSPTTSAKMDETKEKKMEPTQLELNFGSEEAERRIDIIGANGPTGEHYEEQ
jgi:hypothetical protein